MKRPGKKAATDRSFVVALSRGLDVLRAFHPNDGLLGNQEIAARTKLPKPTISRLTYTLTKLGYLTPVPRFEKYQLAPSAMALGYAALANLGVRHLSEPYREALMRETGGAVAVGGRDRHSMIYFGQSRTGLLGVQLDVGSRVPIATTAMGRAYIWALPDDERAALLRELREHYGSRWARMRDGIERAGEMVDASGLHDLRRRMAGRCARGRRGAEAQRWNRTVRLQLWRAGFPFHGRSPDQRYWTSPCDDGKEHRGGAGQRGPAIQKRRKQEVESRRESCTFGRGDQVAIIMASASFRAVIPAP